MVAIGKVDASYPYSGLETETKDLTAQQGKHSQSCHVPPPCMCCSCCPGLEVEAGGAGLAVLRVVIWHLVSWALPSCVLFCWTVSTSGPCGFQWKLGFVFCRAESASMQLITSPKPPALVLSSGVVL